jgi:hypothetical protein
VGTLPDLVCPGQFLTLSTLSSKIPCLNIYVQDKHYA